MIQKVINLIKHGYEALIIIDIDKLQATSYLLFLSQNI